MQDELFIKLKKRTSISDENLLKIIYIISKYGIKLNIRNFDQFGLRLLDGNNKVVRIICDGVIKNSHIFFDNLPLGDIYVIYADGILSGWIESAHIKTVNDSTFCVDAEFLHAMPSVFMFVQTCPHLDIYGGFSVNGDGWICANCKEKLVFNDT
jgi:hypothetical protein